MNTEKWVLDLEEILKAEDLNRFEEIQNQLEIVIKKWSQIITQYSANGYMSRKPAFGWINEQNLRNILIELPIESYGFRLHSFELKGIRKTSSPINSNFYFSFYLQNHDNQLMIKYYFNQIPVNYDTYNEDVLKVTEPLDPNNKSVLEKTKELIGSGETDAQRIFECETILLDILNSSLKTFLLNNKDM